MIRVAVLSKVVEEETAANEDDEDLYAIVTAESFDKLKIGVAAVNKVIKSGIGYLKDRMSRKQLRELALLNGTLREDTMGKGFLMHKNIRG